MSKLAAFRTLLALVGIAHLGLGLMANLAPAEPLAKLVSTFYGATIDVTAQTHHVVRILGAFMIGIGVMALLACRDPWRNRAVILGIVAILLLRVAQRALFAQEIGNAFHISTGHLWAQAAFFLATAIALLLLQPKGTAAASSPGTA